MKYAHMTAAQAVFYPYSSPEEAVRDRKEQAVSQFGFYCALDLSDREELPERAMLRIAARHVYRLWINGRIVMHGPARTAHGYARVDEVEITDCLIDGVNHIALEVMYYGDTYNQYSNDCTLCDGPGFVMAELEADGEILTATGGQDWGVCRLIARQSRTGRISHCREASEVYWLDDAYYLWFMGAVPFLTPAPVSSSLPILLPRESPLPTMDMHEYRDLVAFGICRIDTAMPLTPLFYECNPAYAPVGYDESLTEHPLDDCRRTREFPFGGQQGGLHVSRRDNALTLSGAEDTYVLFDGGVNIAGFPTVQCYCEKPGIIDIVRAEILQQDGSVAYHHNLVTRLHAPAGYTFITAMEPGVARYIKVYFRGVGEVTVSYVGMMEYAYPDRRRSGFLCSDDNINRLWHAARQTLINNTLDVFMDCPDRERGGWLCDSLWTARAAALMLSDTRVEKEFLQNFLLTSADNMSYGFFPEAYPGQKSSYKDSTGITTWSFWLMCQVCEYLRRTHDTEWQDEFADRIAAFVEGSRHFLGKSGLLENLPALFVDWSESNFSEYQSPVSTAANALYAYMLCELGQVYGRCDWTEEGHRIRTILRHAIIGENEQSLATLRTFPDSFTVDQSGALHSRERISESGMATALWAGLFSPGETPALDRYIRDCMGPIPTYPADPNIGKSQLFIGLCIRLDMLARRGQHTKLWEDLLAIYMPQLKEGPGTLWENCALDNSSRCHGFTSHVGVHLMRDVLGLDWPDMASKTVTVTPHTCGLRWARGTVETPDGLIALEWRYGEDSFTITGTLPSGYTCHVILPREVRCLDADKVTVDIQAQHA